MDRWVLGDALVGIVEATRVYRVIAGDPTLADDRRGVLLSAFESAAPASALTALEQTIRD